MASGDVGDELLPGHVATLATEPHRKDRGRIETAVLGWILLVEVGVAPAQVVGEPARGHVEVEAASRVRAVVVEAMDDVRRKEDEASPPPRRSCHRGCGTRTLPRGQGTRRRARGGCAGRRAALPATVDELGESELVRVHEDRRAPIRPVGDLFACSRSGAGKAGTSALGRLRRAYAEGPSCPANHDKPWIPARVLRRRLIVERRARRLQLLLALRGLEPRTKSPNPRLGMWMSRNRAGLSPLTENVCTTSGGTNAHVSGPILRSPSSSRSVSAPSAPKKPRRGADGDEAVAHGRRLGADLDGAEVLVVSEKRDPEPTLAGDALAVSDFDHRPAA